DSADRIRIISAQHGAGFLWSSIKDSRSVAMSDQTRDEIISAMKKFSGAGVMLDSGSRPNALRVTVAPSVFLGLSDYLQSQFGGRPELILAEDTRAQARGGFTLRYVFELPNRDAFVIVSMPLGKDERSFPSLATRWYAASL